MDVQDKPISELQLELLQLSVRAFILPILSIRADFLSPAHGPGASSHPHGFIHPAIFPSAIR
jgi:hypothetical protein